MKSFFKNTLLIASGAASGQIILIIVSPLLTRLFTPEDFGSLAIYTAILSIFVTIAALRFDFAVYVAENRKETINLIVLSFISLFIVTMLITIFIFFFRETIVRVFSMNINPNYLFLLPMSLLGLTGYGILSKLALKRQVYKVVAKTKFVQSFTVGVFQTLFGIISIKPGLILGDVIGRFSGLLQVSTVINNEDKKEFKKISMNSLKETVIKYKNYPLYSSFSNLLNNGTLQMPPLLIAVFFGEVIVGFYALLSRVVGVPMRFIGQSVSEVYLGEISNISKSNYAEIKNLFHNLIIRLSLIAILPFIIVLLFGPQIFGFIFGEQWIDAGNYLRILSISYFIQFVMFPLSQTLEVLEKQKIQLIWQITRFVLVSLSLIIPAIIGCSVEVTLFIYSIAVVLTYTIIYFIMLYELTQKKK